MENPQKRFFITLTIGLALLAVPLGRITFAVAKPHTPPVLVQEAPKRVYYKHHIAVKEEHASARRCLAQAIYFEARSEPVVGWEAVAEVVMHRVLDKRYPSTICGVVFQGEYRRHRCQFSFACDGLSDRPRNRRIWSAALQVADTKLARYHLPPEQARATHYHADYVAPSWSKKMVRLEKIGRHIFYADNRARFHAPL